MTLLMMETRQADQVFAGHWRSWQCGEGASQPGQPVTGALFDHFPFLLYEYFDIVPMGAARRVALAARAGGMAQRLYYIGSRGGCEPAWVVRASQWLQAFAVEQLSVDLPLESPSWQSMSAGYRRLHAADSRDLVGPGTESPGSPGRLWSGVADTTALAHATTHVFAALADRPAPVRPLTESQTHLYAGLTLYQNCVTWKEDFLRGHPSHVVPLLIDEMDAGPPTTGTDRAAQVMEAARRFYYGGLAERTLDAAAEHLCRAMAAVTDLPPYSWGQRLAGFLQDVRGLRADLGRIRRDRLANVRGLSAPRHASRGQGTPLRPRRDGAEAAARLAIAGGTASRFVRNEQAPAGFWGDFLLLGQQSTSWVTGYVGWNLAVSGAAEVDLDAAADWLAEHQLPGGGWGYNGHWPVDVDSTAHGLLFLTIWRSAELDRWMPVLEHVLSTQRPDGGFATITDPGPWLLRFRSDAADLRGWTASHPCVTAVVALLFAGLDGTSEQHAAVRAVKYLRACQRPEGYWDAYWWMGRLYTTCRAVQAMGKLGRRVELPGAASCLARAAAWLVGSQRVDGGWASIPSQRPRPFPTALAVQALHGLRDALPAGYNDQDDAVGAAIARGARWLLERQLPDGSWPTSPILRVPRPELLNPWEQTTWAESIAGLDVVVEDWRRLFTTATALRALHSTASPAGDASPTLPTGGTPDGTRRTGQREPAVPRHRPG